MSSFRHSFRTPAIRGVRPQNSGVEVYGGRAYNQRQNGGIPGWPMAPTQLATHAAINIPAKRFDDEQR